METPDLCWVRHQPSSPGTASCLTLKSSRCKSLTGHTRSSRVRPTDTFTRTQGLVFHSPFWRHNAFSQEVESTWLMDPKHIMFICMTYTHSQDISTHFSCFISHCPEYPCSLSGCPGSATTVHVDNNHHVAGKDMHVFRQPKGLSVFAFPELPSV